MPPRRCAVNGSGLNVVSSQYFTRNGGNNKASPGDGGYDRVLIGCSLGEIGSVNYSSCSNVNHNLASEDSLHQSWVGAIAYELHIIFIPVMRK
ncbi:hypothetical protein CEXT_689451 [Caerostris extrusa]|uniref:Uncharacterized protein n=1 Tax=Caerostris extrusa TaxID=172846 RepID=A0AAV4RSG1_CAEEX|nr:hypothetical protein CEXT_689451 [Caerostris extrusa]